MGKIKENRKIDGDRVYKLARATVVTISVVALIYGVYLFTSDERSTHTDLEEYGKCGGNSFNRTPDYCDVWMNDINIRHKAMDISLYTGLLLPIAFFGGGALINYLAPKTKKTKGENNEKQNFN